MRQGKPSFPRGGSSKRRGDVTTKFPPQSVYINMPWVSSASNSFCPTWGHEGVWMQCYIRCRIHHLTRVEDTLGDLCLIGFHDRCMTDWAHANLVSSSMLHQLDRSSLTGQTCLSRDWLSLILQSKSIASRRRRMKLSPCKLILGRLQPVMSCRLAMSTWLSRTLRKD